jgi:hypothetical protein
MISPLSLAISALNAFGQKPGTFHVDANGHEKPETLAREGRNGEVTSRGGRAENPGAFGQSPRGSGPVARESSDTGPEERAPEPVTTVYGFRADLKTVKAPDGGLGHLLNTLA